MAKANMTETERREAGRAIFGYARELLNEHGDGAELKLHADHIRSLLIFEPSRPHG